MGTWMNKALGWGVVASLAVAASGCAVTAGSESSVATMALTYDRGRPAVPRLQQPVAQVVVPSVQGANAAAPGIVYFDFDRYDIQPRYRDDIEAYAGMLRADPEAGAMVEGHTDQYGSVEYNLALGQRRAEAVRRALVQLGARDAQVEAISYGELKLAEPGEDAASRALNRRAEFRRAR